MKEENLPVALLVTHYHAAMRHGTSDADERRRLTAALFDIAHKQLDEYVARDMAAQLVNIDVKENLTPLFEAVCMQDNINFLPRDASRRLAAAVMKASATASVVDFSVIKSWDNLDKFKKQITAAADTALHYADLITQPRPEASVETSKDIAPVKRITLKAAEGGQPS